MKKACLLFATILIICSGVFGHSLLNALADEPAAEYTSYYTSLKIEDGQSLWSIAQIYNVNSGMEIPEYIEELKSINQLNGDTIHAGRYLTVVYFVETLKE